ncbi:MAG TPA: hypothetical protein VFX22_04925, partial [Candidatus Kapabacteria bacterium]|nr:hypothetical protein [Candidatus Kapabacteria bacterium]
MPALTTFPYGDDAFYLFSIAKHLANGHGPTVDGINLTNGFQPLIVLLYTPIFWLCGSNSWLAVRWTFLLNGAIAALTVWAIAVLIRKIERAPGSENFSTPTIGAAIWTFTFTIFAQTTNGLETGLSSLLIFISLIFYAKIDSTSRGWTLGLVLGFAVLARIDAAILVAIIVLTLLVKKRTRLAIVTGGMALLVSAPWWLFNWFYFGSLMPTSGQAENIWPLPPHENIYRATEAISNILSLIFYLPNSLNYLLRILWLLIILGGIVFLIYRTHLINRMRRTFRMDILWSLAIFSIVLFFYYTLFFRAPHFLERYFEPARMLWSVCVAAGVSIFWKEKIGRKIIIAAAVIGVVFSLDRYTTDY